MEHLSIEDIIAFVSMKELNEQTMSLGKKVNGHIRFCKSCFKRVRASQELYDEFRRGNGRESFEQYLYDQLLSVRKKLRQDDDLEMDAMM